MSTVTLPRPIRQHKPLPPVRGSARWLTRPDGRGRGQLVIHTEAGVDRLYAVEPVVDGGAVVGWAFTRLGSGEVYHVNVQAADWSCDCPAYTFTAHNRGPCKHVSALRAALLAIGWSDPSAVLAEARAYEQATA
jgi:hypothetical protein